LTRRARKLPILRDNSVVLSCGLGFHNSDAAKPTKNRGRWHFVVVPHRGDEKQLSNSDIREFIGQMF
jgi:hypothetical protein